MIKKVRTHHKFMINYSLLFLRALTRPAIVFIFFTALGSIILSAFGFYHFEYGTNPQIHDPLDALYYTITLFSGVGLGDIVPSTRGGKVLSMFIMLIGTGLYASFTAIAAATLLSLESRE